MKSKVPFIYRLIPLIYVALIAGFLYAHFGGSVRFREQIGAIAVAATYPSSWRSDSGSPSDVTIIVGDVALESAPYLELHYGNEEVQTAKLTALSTRPDGVDILFGDKASVSMSTIDEETTEIVINFQDSDVNEILLPLDGAPVRVIGKIALYRTGGAVIALPRTAYLAEDPPGIVVSNTSGTNNRFLVVSAESISSDYLGFWFSRFYQFGSDDDLRDGIRRFLDATYRGWSTSRLNRSDGTWMMADGTYSFDEDILAMFATESLAIGAFRKTYPVIQQITKNQTGKLTHKSAAILGDIVIRSESINEENRLRFEKIRSFIENRDVQVFSVPDLVPFVFDRVPFAIVQELLDLLSSAEPTSLTSRSAVGAAEFLLESAEYVAEARTALEAEGYLESLIVPHLAVETEGLAILDDRNQPDIESSIRAGLVLLRSVSPTSILSKIGRELIISGISRTDDDGFFQFGSVADEKDFEPERLIRKFSDNPYLPKEVSLFRELGPGKWLWTTAGDVTVDAMETTLTISFTFPVGSAHHLIIRGIEPFRSVRLFGIPWNSDAFFQIYPSGWLYNAETKTLFAKISHRSEREQIVIER